jgi:MerR family transcriptional regulator, light-induced transcriptional regulator
MQKPTDAQPHDIDSTPRFRSGAVARMVAMPVTTLRVWERRYGLGKAQRSAGGHRLYEAADVERLALIKRLTQRGHAVGALAHLDLDALHQVAATHATTRASTITTDTRPSHTGQAPTSLVVVGGALMRRLHRPELAQRLEASETIIVASFDTLAEARRSRGMPRADLLLVGETALSETQPRALQAAARSWQATHVAVVYGYGAAPAREAHRRAGIELLREVHDDSALITWLLARIGHRLIAAETSPTLPTVQWVEALPVSPRRYDDLTLTDFAGLSSTIACECPRHVAELLMQLSHFEDYSATCASRSPRDTDLHEYLRRVAGASRALFEQALERVAEHEGLLLKR